MRSTSPPVSSRPPNRARSCSASRPTGWFVTPSRSRAFEPLTLKGKSQPVRVYGLLEVIQGVPPLARRFDTPFVGRKEELAQLLGRFEWSVAERTPVLVTVLGPAGIGKTRLAGEFVGKVGQVARVLHGRCLSYGEGITYWPLQEILRSLPERPSGAPDPEQATSREEAFWAYRKLFEALAQEDTLVLVLEVIHWAEPTLLDLVEQMISWTHDAPIFVLCLARSEVLDDRPSWLGERVSSSSRSLSRKRMLWRKRSSLLSTQGRRRAPSPSLRETRSSSSICLRLPRRKLAATSRFRIRSRRFSPPVWTASMTMNRAFLERPLSSAKNFGSARSSTFPRLRPRSALSSSGLCAGGSFSRRARACRARTLSRFGHILVRDAAYNAISKTARATLHERFAYWLEASGSHYEEIMGYHLEQAYRLLAELGPVDERSDALRVRARDCLWTGGEGALVRGDAAAATSLLERARELSGSDPDAVGLALPLSEALTMSGRLAQAERLLVATIQEGRDGGDKRTEWLAKMEVTPLQGQLHPDQWDSGEVRGTAEKAIAVFSDLRDEGGLARAWALMSEVEFRAGRYDASREMTQRAREHARRSRDRRQEATYLANLASTIFFGTTPADEAIVQIEGLLEEVSDRGVEASMLLKLAGLHAMEGRFELARSMYERSKAIRTEMGQELQSQA